MPSKKRKLSFDLDDYEAKQGGILQICKMLDNFSIQEAKGFLDPEKILGLAVIKLGLGFVMNILSVISVIPWPVASRDCMFTANTSNRHQKTDYRKRKHSKNPVR